MKRIFRVAIIVIPVAVLLAGIGLWRHHYLTIMKTEPEKVYNNKLVQPNKITSDANIPKVPRVKENAITDATDVEPSKSTQRTDNRIRSKEMVNTSNSSTDTIFGDIAEENLTPEVVAAIKKYKEIQSAIPALNKELKPLLVAEPLDMDAITLINEKKRNLRQQRKDILESLSIYSVKAFDELQSTLAREKAAERIVTELDGSVPLEENADDNKRNAELKRKSDEIDELHKSIQNLSRKELEEASEKLEELSEELSKSKKGVSK